jgi:nucleotide-binding universal stress UspA family protein
MKTLLYVEPTFRGEWALGLAHDLVRVLDGTLVLLTIKENLLSHPRLLDDTAARFAGLPQVRVERRVRPGPARDAIVAEARECSPVVTIVPPAGRKGLARLIKGSRVKSVVDRAPSTVMVARRPVGEHIGRILLAVSGGPMSETTALGAVEIARSLGARITLLHVTSSVALPSGTGGKDELAAPLAGVRRLLDDAGVSAETRVREGMVIPEVLAECRDGGHDLLIIGQHLAAPEAGGSLAENIAVDLALASPIPVLIVRPRTAMSGR